MAESEDSTPRRGGRKPADLTGQKFGMLTAIEPFKDVSGQTRWRCRCDCGKPYDAQPSNLRSGSVVSCGCVRRAGRKTEDIANQRFGALVALERAETVGRAAMWRCRCDCGNLHTASSGNLRRGDVASCGCGAIPRKQRKFEDLTGQRFAMLTVERRAPNYERLPGGPQTMMWECRCDCGELTTVSGSNLRRKITGSCGCARATGATVRPLHVRDRTNAYIRQRYRGSIVFALNRRIRALLRASLRKARLGKSKRTESLLGYSLAEAREHLGRTMPDGYTWDDFLAGHLEIDHKKPLAAFRITGEDCPALREAWALSNLQLLPRKTNREKWHHLDTPWS